MYAACPFKGSGRVILRKVFQSIDFKNFDVPAKLRENQMYVL